MSEKTIITCDECPEVRNKTNHWFSAFGSLTRPTFSTFDEARAETSRILKDYCGQKCATSAFHRFLETGSIEKETK